MLVCVCVWGGQLAGWMISIGVSVEFSVCVLPGYLKTIYSPSLSYRIIQEELKQAYRLQPLGV